MPEHCPSSSAALAAIDLGSNSFRLELGLVHQGRYRIQHCNKQMVSLGAGLDAQGMLSRESMERGLLCLHQFAAELAALRPRQLRVVATQTLREARNGNHFMCHAEAILGQPVEIIPGKEEARLIYAGVAFLQPSGRRRLVIDIGGRSTEMIVGQGNEARSLASFRIGSASISQRFFVDGRMTAERFRLAQAAIAAALRPGLAPFAALHWDEALGASGTAGMLSRMLHNNGITDGSLTPAALGWLTEQCVAAGSVDGLDMAGLKEKRRKLLPGVLAILSTVVALCGIRELRAAKGALRQGVIVDLHQRCASSARLP